MPGTKKPFKEEVLKELPAIGKYRIRIVQSEKDDGTKRAPALDIREYLTKEKEGDYEGFTKRGIRLTSAGQVDLLKDALVEALTCGQME